jgi:5-methylcytosine-specific restriction endonuclease McrA
LALALALATSLVVAKGGGHSHGSATTSSQSATQSSKSHSSTGSHSKAAPWVHRDSHGKIARDPRQTNEFKRQHLSPSTGKSSGSCPGCVIDHVTPLKRGGADAPSNMQWQTEAAAKQKDKWEWRLALCRNSRGRLGSVGNIAELTVSGLHDQ